VACIIDLVVFAKFNTKCESPTMVTLTCDRFVGGFKNVH
jgi:hypothetical protein